MPSEIRRLIFSWPEVSAALTHFIQNRRVGVGPGIVTEPEVANTQPLAIRARIQARTGQQSTETFEEAVIAAALISWCIKEKIPMSRNSSKAVRVSRDGHIALDTTLSG